MNNHHPLLYTPAPRPMANMRLVCFNYAGGGISTYIPWLNYLSSDVELTLIQLPGRGIRIKDAPYETMSDMVRDIFEEYISLPLRKSIFFGHSLGAMVAYELILKLYRNQCRLPIHFFASGSSAPFIENQDEPIHDLADNDFIKEIKSLNGTPDELLKNYEFMKLILPVLRADFKISESYLNCSLVRIPTSLSVFYGANDSIEICELEAWIRLFNSNTGLHKFNDDHFFVDSSPELVVNEISKILKKYHAPTHGGRSPVLGAG